MEIEKEVKKVSVEPAGRRPDKGAPTVGQVTGQSCAASGPRRGSVRFGFGFAVVVLSCFTSVFYSKFSSTWTKFSTTGGYLRASNTSK